MTTPTGGGTTIASLAVELNVKDLESGIPVIESLAPAAGVAVKSLDALKKEFVELVAATKASTKASGDKVKALRDEIAAIEGVVRAEASARKAVEETAIAETTFLATLQRKLDTLGMTEVQLLRYTAAEKQAGAAASILIDAIEAQTSGLKALEYSAFRTMEANEALYLKTTSAAEYSALRVMEANEAVYLKSVTARAADEASLLEHIQKEIAINAQKEKAAEYAALRTMEANEALYLKTTAAAEYAALKQMEANEAVYLKKQAQMRADEAALQAHVAKEIAANEARLKSAEYKALKQMEAQEQLYLKEVAAEQAAVALAEKQAIEEIKWAATSVKARIAELERLKAYQAESAIRPETIASNFSSAAIKDLPNLTRLQEEYNASLEKTHNAHKKVAGSAEHLGISMGNSKAKTEVLVLAHELVQGRYTRFGASLMVLAEYTNMASLAFTGFGATLLAVGGTLAFLGYAMIKGIASQREMTNAVITTGYYSQMTADKLNDLAHSATETSGSIGEAKKAVSALAASGKFVSEQMGNITDAVVAMSHATGRGVEELVKEFETLAVQARGHTSTMTHAVGDAVLKLDDHYHFLTTSIYEQIVALEKEGRAKEAGIIATNEFARVTKERAHESAENIGNIQKAWHAVTRTIGEAIDKAGNWGKRVTPKMQVDALSSQLTTMDANEAEMKAKGMTPNPWLAVTATRAREDVVNRLVLAADKLNKLDAEANAEGLKNRRNSEANHAIQENEAMLLRAKRREMTELNIALEAYRENNRQIALVEPDAERLLPKNVQRDEELLIKAHSLKAKAAENDGYNTRLQTQLQAVDASYALAKKATEDNEKLVKDSMRANTMTEEVGYEKMRIGRANEMVALVEWYKKRNDVLDQYKGKKLRDEAMVERERSSGASNFTKHSSDIVAVNKNNDADEVNAKAKAYQKLTEEIETSNNKEIDALDRVIEKQRQHNLEIGKTKEQIQLAREATEQAYMATVEREAEAIAWVLQEASIRGNMTTQDVELYTVRLAHLNSLIAKQKEYSDLFAKGAKLEADVALTKGLDKAAKKWIKFGDTIGKALSDGFGKGGKAMGQMLNAYAKGQASQLQIDKERDDAFAAAEKMKNEAALRKAAQDNHDQQSAVNRMNEYGNMAGAAAGFFDEQSKGYKAMMLMSQVFHAAELAMTLARLVPLGIEAVLNQAKGDPYTAFARMAMMAAAVAALGVAIGPVGGGTSREQTSKYRQEAAGAGSVLGAGNTLNADGSINKFGDKSESIANSLDMLESAADKGLYYSSKMVNSLHIIATNISGLANLVARTTGLTTGAKTGITEGTVMGQGALFMAGGPMGLLASKLPGLGGLFKKMFGVTTSIVDEGIINVKATLGDLETASLQVQSYATVNTKKKILGLSYSDKTREQTSVLDDEINNQFTKVVRSISDGVFAAADALGMGGSDFIAKMNTFVVDLGHISLKGLTGKEMEEQFQAVFSKLGDDMAKFAFDGLLDFQKIGEGMFETLSRLASDYQMLDAGLRSIGMTFGAVGVSSIRAREDLIEMSGGIDKFVENIQGFAENFLTEAERLAPVKDYVTESMKALGYASVDTKEEFRDLVKSLKGADPASAILYAALMKLQGAFAEVTPELLKVEGGVLSLADAKSALSEAYDTESEALKTTIDRLKDFTKGLLDMKDTLKLGGLSPLTPGEKYLEARKQFDKVKTGAAAGNEDDQANFTAALDTFLSASQVANASGAKYQADFAYAMGSLDEAAGWAKDQVDVAEASLTALNKQVEGLIDVKKEVINVSAAIIQLAASMGTTGGAMQDASSTNAIQSLYQNMLDRPADADGLAFWKKMMSQGSSLTDISGAISGSDEYKKLNGSLSVGMGYVPFDGYVAELHRGEAVLTASEAVDYRNMGTSNMAPLVTEIRTLQSINRELVAEVQKLRIDASEQTGDTIQSNAQVGTYVAEKVVAATLESGKMVTQQNNSTWTPV